MTTTHKTTIATPATEPAMLSRRQILMAASTLAAGVLPGMARAAQAPVKIGLISPLTGPLASFGESDKYMVGKIQALLKDGLTVNGTTYPVEILVRDCQSNPNKAAELAGNLILTDKVHLMLPASTTDAINPVADQCELNGVPCLSSQAPWQAFFFQRGGKLDKPFKWTYHFFWGLEDVISVYTSMWNSVSTNKKVGLLFPRNADGEGWGSKEFGLPSAMAKTGFEAVTPSSFQPLTSDFSAQITEYKKSTVDIIGGIAYPADLRTFITQCRQQQFKPKVVTVAAALLFPSAVEAMGDLGPGMSTEVWWTPAFPFKSSLTGETCAKLADDWEASSKKQWTQPLGYAHALWEVAIDALKRSKNPLDRESIRQAITTTNLTTVAGQVNFASGGPVKNVAKTAVLGGQWVKGTKHKLDLRIVDVSLSKSIAAEGKLTLM